MNGRQGVVWRTTSVGVCARGVGWWEGLGFILKGNYETIGLLNPTRRATPFGGGGLFLTLRGNTSGHGTIRAAVVELCLLSEYIRFPCFFLTGREGSK